MVDICDTAAIIFKADCALDEVELIFLGKEAASHIIVIARMKTSHSVKGVKLNKDLSRLITQFATSMTPRNVNIFIPGEFYRLPIKGGIWQVVLMVFYTQRLPL